MQDQDEAQFPVRVPWTWAPVRLRQRVSVLLGSGEVASVDVRGGMSPGPAAVLSLGDGRRVFAKAVSAQVNAASHELYLWEAAALRALPVDVPAPDLLGVVQDGDWVALITSFAPGTAAGPPWSTATIRAVADACERLAAHRAPTGIPPVIDRLPDLDGWAKLTAGEAGPLDLWEARHVEQLARLTDGWRDWTRGVVLSAARRVKRRARSAAILIKLLSLPGDGSTSEPSSIAGLAVTISGAQGRRSSSSDMPNMACSARLVAGVVPADPRSPLASRPRCRALIVAGSSNRRNLSANSS
ncbi:hypothetical protein [Micromonospora sp. RTP1Z1]|uniref:hypothetical protein n=1 Tax=Micromonospora sp. RTP1Z1 TaxID=2994043 RepID=UPI0029C7BBBC|nr:hypothetical protein [Micromonospora sp. RTP1Z1]